ncbi:hypothetical protein ID866_11081, partial [Astraeus odoratus]
LLDAFLLTSFQFGTAIRVHSDPPPFQRRWGHAIVTARVDPHSLQEGTLAQWYQ